MLELPVRTSFSWRLVAGFAAFSKPLRLVLMLSINQTHNLDLGVLPPFSAPTSAVIVMWLGSKNSHLSNLHSKSSVQHQKNPV